MRLLITAAALSLAALSVQADAVPSNLALVRKIMNLPAMQQMFSAEGMNQSLAGSLGALTKSSGGALPQGMMDSIKFTEADAKKLHDLAEMEYLKIFTEPELQVMYDFYSTPTGEAIAKKMPKLTEAVAPFIAQLQRDKMMNMMQHMRSGKQ